MTGLLDRLDDRLGDAAATVGRGEVAGWVCVGIGGLAAVLSAGGVVALYFWGDLLTVGDLW